MLIPKPMTLQCRQVQLLVCHVIFLALPTNGLCFFNSYGSPYRRYRKVFKFIKAILLSEPIDVFD